MSLESIIDEERRLFAYESELFGRLRFVARKLNVQILETIVRVRVVRKKDGMVKSFREQHVHSFVRNLHNIAAAFPVGDLTGSTYADGSLAIKDVSAVISGGAIPVDFGQNWETGGSWMFGAANSSSYFGVVVGRDNTAYNIDNFELGNQITHGTGPNQLTHNVSVLTEGWNGGSSYYWSKHSRPFDNNTVASVTVEEMGLAIHNTHLLSRDLISGGQVLAVSDRLFAEYETRASF